MNRARRSEHTPRPPAAELPVTSIGTVAALALHGGGLGHGNERRAGSSINLGSKSGLIINRPQTAASYMASKGAVHMLTKALATEWAKSGVRVNALAPGYVATDMTLKLRERPELFNTWLDMTPMGRLGEPSEIASAVVYLASAASSFITGSVLSIDGGYTAW